MIRQFKFHGSLKEKYGESASFDADTPRMMLSGLNSRFNDFRQTMNGLEVRLIKDQNGKYDGITEQEIGMNFGNCKVIHIVPETKGAFMAPALIAMGVAATTAYVISTVVFVATVAYGASMAHKMAHKEKTEIDKNSSTLLQGPANTNVQGCIVPRVYGEMTVGTVLASVGIKDEDVMLSTGNTTTTQDQAIKSAIVKVITQQ